jgi:membrane protein DedA with SNARE-associated domain
MLILAGTGSCQWRDRADPDLLDRTARLSPDRASPCISEGCTHFGDSGTPSGGHAAAGYETRMSPAETVRILEHYGIVILPGLVVAEQFGIPLPAVPALLGFGALAAHGRGSIPLMLGALVAVALTVDLGWYELGRRRGAPVLARLCRFTLEPDSCLRRADAIFTRHGVQAMLIAKFVPGLTTILPPLAGIFRTGRVRFAVYEVTGVLLWAGTWIGLGYVFSDAVAQIAGRVASFGLGVGLTLGAAVAGYIVVKYVRRALFLRGLRTARISPEVLKRRLDAGEDIIVVDLRTRLDVAATPYAIPGSRWMVADEIDEHQSEILRPRDFVLYCS